MKTPKPVSAAVIAIALAAVTIIGCKKDDTLPVTPATAVSNNGTEANDNFIASSSFNDAADMMTYGIARSAYAGTLITLPVNFPENIIEPLQATCAHITFGLPNTATIDFGAGCTDRDGNQRSGEIKVHWIGDITAVGTRYFVTFNNYYFNYNLVEGNVEVTNQGQNSMGHFTFNVAASGSVTVLNPSVSGDKSSSMMRFSGQTMTYNSFNTIERIPRAETDGNREAEHYLVSGRSEGKTLDGRPYSTQILIPLKKVMGYPFYISGTQKLAFKNGDLRTIDYGYSNNEKDDLASVIIGTNVQVIIHLNRNPLMIANIH